MDTKRKIETIETIDAETWAESGGTAGVYGRLWAAGRLKIVPSTGNRVIPASFRITRIRRGGH